jgi:phosphoglycerate dehydrogenase-like enzyme
MPQPPQPLSPLTIWTNYRFPPTADAQFIRGIDGHRLIRSATMQASNLVSGPADATLADADIALGQPDPAALITAPRVRWVHLTSAGYDRYDTPAVRAAMAQRNGQITNSSLVYEEPCAQHALAMMMALARQLPQSLDAQRFDRGWLSDKRRIESFLLTGQTAVILSYGAIARRLIELLTPFRMTIYAVRRLVRGDEIVPAVAEKHVASVLPLADHLINILPGGEATWRYMDAAKLALLKLGAIFYNIGRGGTVDQDALLAALQSRRLRYAYLDVTDPEPLPPSHPLWSHPSCFITPHTAGGAADEFERLAAHFLDNLRRFERGDALVNRVV